MHEGPEPEVDQGAMPGDEEPSGVHANELAPDHVEEDRSPFLGDGISSRGYRLHTMVGLGGSAGSLQALLVFLQQVPVDTGMVFVVVVHLSPDHESMLATLLQRATTMPVIQVNETVRVQPNHVYVIPPNRSLAAADGYLRLAPLQSERGRRVAVDLFFRTLADSYGPHSIAVVLSGADGDGAIGIKRVKERGGLTIAQDPVEAEHSGMPTSSIDTGMIDWILTVGEMPGRIARYVAQERRLALPSLEAPSSPDQADVSAGAEAALQDVLVHLRTRTGRDFIDYKRATILRRIARRMQVNGVDDLTAYLIFLRTHPGEAAALLQELLISVTNFFRDDRAFAALEARIPGLFAGKGPQDVVRVWVPGCATGEEAYSLAILLSEHARTLESPPKLQIFATDLDEQVIQAGRTGLYPLTIQADVSEDRLRRFFIREQPGYRVGREIRETVLFALHDLRKDSPFSRLDLISCRNLLIYLNRSAQQHVLEIFHYALNPGGRLFLGASESVAGESTLFATLDKKHRIYEPRVVLRAGLPVKAGTSALTLALRSLDLNHENATGAHGAIIPSHFFPAIARRSDVTDDRHRSWPDLHFRLLEQLGPPSVLVDAAHQIVHVSETAGRFLRFGGGEPSSNLLRAVHPALQAELRAALYQVAEVDAPAETSSVPIDLDGVIMRVTARVTSAGASAPGFFLVMFRSQEDAALAGAEPPQVMQPDQVVQQLERELEGTRASLLNIVEQFEASTEELQASNEELQAMNEELRSATEELETSREELQSINEELTTVNLELKANVEDLGDANSDLHNLMGASAIATVFLDRTLRITRFTPSAVQLFNLIASDVGRPLTDLKHRFDYPDLERDAAMVLERLSPIEREVGERSGGWFLARWLPYRTLEDRIAGVVLTLVDITERKRSEKALEQSRAELLAALRDTERARSAAEAATLAKDRFIAVLSHELRTPLTPALMAVRLLQREDGLTTRAMDLIAMIHRNIEIETRLIDELLDVTRIANGKLLMRTETMDLHEAVRAGVEIAEPEIETKEQQLILTLEAEQTRITGDPARLQQAIWNLVKNASKFTPAGGRLRVNTRNEEGMILVVVSDDGLGIAPAMLERIFDPFRQVKEGPSEFGGLGLGLAISRSIIVEHGGQIVAASDGPGKGATFTVRLPLDPDATA